MITLTVDSIQVLNNAVVIMKESQSQIPLLNLETEAIKFICIAVVSVVFIICLLIYKLKNINEKRHIRSLIMQDKDIQDLLIKNIKDTDAEEIRKNINEKLSQEEIKKLVEQEVLKPVVAGILEEKKVNHDGIKAIVEEILKDKEKPKNTDGK